MNCDCKLTNSGALCFYHLLMVKCLWNSKPYLTRLSMGTKARYHFSTTGFLSLIYEPIYFFRDLIRWSLRLYRCSGGLAHVNQVKPNFKAPACIVPARQLGALACQRGRTERFKAFQQKKGWALNKIHCRQSFLLYSVYLLPFSPPRHSPWPCPFPSLALSLWSLHPSL